MKDPQNITIAILLATAVVLGTMLAFTLGTREAQAAASVRGAQYIMVTGEVSNIRDVLYVIDITSRQVCVYDVNWVKKTLDLVDRKPLDEVFGTTR
jgi:uncharacterized SAM-binding protein YcdF (DUF218 family)